MTLRDLEVAIVDRETSEIIDVIDEAIPSESTEQWGGLGGGRFTFPTRTPKWSKVELMKREVQFRHGNTCKWWGIPAVGRADMRSVTVECVGLPFYYMRRLAGPSYPEGLELVNGGFEDDLTGWSGVNLDSATVSTTIRARGDKAARLVNSTVGEDAFLRQIATLVHSGPPGGAVSFALAGRCHIDPTVPFEGAAYKQRGLFCEVTTGGVPGDLKVATIPYAGTKRGEFIPLLIPAVFAPTGATSDFDVRLYCGAGAFVWDEIYMLPEQFIGDLSLQYNDYRVLIEQIIDYCHGKGASLNIARNVRDTGVTTNRLIPFSDHGVLGNELNDLHAAGICTWGVTWNDLGTQKTIETWSPSRGDDNDEAALEMGRNIEGIRSYERDGTRAVNKGRGLGDGSGATRSLAEYTDTADLDGLVLEGTVQVPPQLPLLELDRVTQEEVTRLRRGAVSVTVTVKEDYLSTVELGDRVRVNVDWGWIQIDNERMRITEWTRYHTLGTAAVKLDAL